MFTVTPLFPVSIMSHKMETLEELVMMMKLLQELTDPDGRGGAANEPGTCHHNGAAPPGLAARVPISPEHGGEEGGGALCGPSAHYTPSSSTGLFFPRRAGRPETVTRHRVGRHGGEGGGTGRFSLAELGGKNRKKEQRRWRWRREVGGGGGQQ